MKKQSFLQIIFLSLILVAFAGCDTNKDDPEDIVGSFDVTVTGAISQTINSGQAAFGAATDARTGISGFALALGNTTGTTAQSLLITRKADRPGNGSYSIANVDLNTDVDALSTDTFIAIYSSGTDVFYSDGGTLSITSSSDSRLEGSVNITATSILGTGAEITITGSFNALGSVVN